MYTSSTYKIDTQLCSRLSGAFVAANLFWLFLRGFGVGFRPISTRRDASNKPLVPKVVFAPTQTNQLYLIMIFFLRLRCRRHARYEIYYFL